MTRYSVEKWSLKEGKMIADYGTFSNPNDVKAIVRGYRKNEFMMRNFGIECYMRKKGDLYCDTYYIVEEKEYC